MPHRQPPTPVPDPMAGRARRAAAGYKVHRAGRTAQHRHAQRGQRRAAEHPVQQQPHQKQQQPRQQISPDMRKDKTCKTSALRLPRAIHSPSSSAISDAASGNTIRSAKSGLGVFIIPVPFLILETFRSTQKHISLRFLHKASAIIIVTSTKKSTLFLQKIFKSQLHAQLLPPLELFRLRRCFRQGRVHQHRIRANGLDLLPWDGQAIVPAQQPEQPWPPQQDQALQPGGGRVKGQVVGPAKADPCSSCTTSFSHSSRMVNALLPFLPQLMQPPGRIMQKAVETAWQIVVYCGQSIP